MIRLFILLSSVTFSSLCFSQDGLNIVRYFDENYKEITEKEYGQKLRTFNFFEVPGDSAHHRLLTTGRESGRITNRKVLESLLEKTTGQDLDSSKPLVILYYPGPDPCNSSGTKKKWLIREWYSELEEGLDQVVNVKPVYIYKESQGLDKYDGVVKWHKDPQRIVEKLFFKYHYPCSSFVVISSEGDYICVFGEHGKEVVWRQPISYKAHGLCLKMPIRTEVGTIRIRPV